ncbi:MAG TPA: MFS transporter [Streptosporangiaceae bacterium]|nr:MFS transporter [Streptosporangiaceae bacterium]
MKTHAIDAAASPVRHRAFRLLFGAQAISTMGDTFTDVALPFAVLQLTGSVADIGYVLAAQTVPLVLFLLFGGVWADRVPRRSSLLVGSNLVRFGSQATIALLLLTGTAHLWQLIALIAVHGLATAVFYPAATGLVPQTVSEQDLQQANALLSFTISSSSVVGPALAGGLVVLAGPGWAIAIDAVSFAVSGLLLMFVRVPGTIDLNMDGGTIAQLRSGWYEVRSRTWVWASIANFAAFQFAGLGFLFVLGPAIAARFLGGPSVWGLLLTAAGVGSVLGDLTALRYRPSRVLIAMTTAILFCVPTLVLLAVAAPTPWLICAQVAFGAGLSFANTTWLTALQQHIPQRALSRVSAYDWMGSSALRPLGQALAGPLAAAIGVRDALLAAAVVIAFSSALTLRLRSVRELRKLAGS